MHSSRWYRRCRPTVNNRAEGHRRPLGEAAQQEVDDSTGDLEPQRTGRDRRALETDIRNDNEI
jgi:hypothetical protein